MLSSRTTADGDVVPGGANSAATAGIRTGGMGGVTPDQGARCPPAAGSAEPACAQKQPAQEGPTPVRTCTASPAKPAHRNPPRQRTAQLASAGRDGGDRCAGRHSGGHARRRTLPGNGRERAWLPGHAG
ncbi:hypothetical protein G6F22_010614 [Rhizopus arrhizus]|nr:hypothetical protein G6F22_010614 [Rhizopus arrhizus]KAG0930866.1 hypothetical protein G6F31_016923 [Rhizopus arrhizus]KAG1250094.1 hypothetical protein G6F68_012985 [Rhizopus microsporus]KAG1272273.1 hypothetical protein G6F65_011827 [Rhizopus arrhizus]